MSVTRAVRIVLVLSVMMADGVSQLDLELVHTTAALRLGFAGIDRIACASRIEVMTSC